VKEGFGNGGIRPTLSCPATQAFIAQILEIKESTPSAPSLSIPSDCIG
jgi:hypothetical protein